MANFDRKAKHPELWTRNDLQAFNINITTEHDMQASFRVSELPVPQNLSSVILNNVEAPAGPLSETDKNILCVHAGRQGQADSSRELFSC